MSDTDYIVPPKFEIWTPERRDYFAAAALNGLLARPPVLDSIPTMRDFIEDSVRYADLLVEALDKK